MTAGALPPADVAALLDQTAPLLIDALLDPQRPDGVALPRAQLRALYAVRACRPAPTLRVLAGRLRASMPSTSRLCTRLETRGWLVRRLDHGDRRTIRLVLTAAGERLLADLRRYRLQRLEAILRRMTSDDRARLAAGLHAFHASGFPTPGPPGNG